MQQIRPNHDDAPIQVFKVARVMAPSVVFIGESEKVEHTAPLLQVLNLESSNPKTCMPAQVFLTDKKKLKEFGGTELFNRIKKELAKEVWNANMMLTGCVFFL